MIDILILSSAVQLIFGPETLAPLLERPDNDYHADDDDVCDRRCRSAKARTAMDGLLG